MSFSGGDLLEIGFVVARYRYGRRMVSTFRQVLSVITPLHTAIVELFQVELITFKCFTSDQGFSFFSTDIQILNWFMCLIWWYLSITKAFREKMQMTIGTLDLRWVSSWSQFNLVSSFRLQTYETKCTKILQKLWSMVVYQCEHHITVQLWHQLILSHYTTVIW